LNNYHNRRWPHVSTNQGSTVLSVIQASLS